MSNPTEGEVEAALWSRMNDLEPHWSTKPIGVAFTPRGGPWQRGTWMSAEPNVVAFGAGAYHRQRGIYQIDLFYPKSERRTDLVLARATLQRLNFYPENGQGLAIEAGAGQLLIDRRPHVHGVDEARDDAYLVVSIDVFVRIELPPA